MGASLPLFLLFKMAAAAFLAPPPPSSSGAAEQEVASTRQEATATNDDVDADRESFPSSSTSPPPSSSLAPNQRVRVRGVPATVLYVGPVAGKDPNDFWIGLEWDDASSGRGKHDGSVGGVRYFETRRRRRASSSSSPSSSASGDDATAPCATGSLVRAAALDAPGVLVVCCSVEEALVRRYGSCGCDHGTGGENGAAAPSSLALPPPSSSSTASFVAGHEEVAARLARIHELEVASVAGTPAAFSLGARGGEEGRGRRGGEAGSEAAEESPPAPLSELAPRLRALDAAGCLFSEWREIQSVLEKLPGLERLDVTRCGGLAAAAVEGGEEDEEEERGGGRGEDGNGGGDRKPPSSASPPLPRPSLAGSPRRHHHRHHKLRELVLAETGAEWATVLSALAASGVTSLRALSLRRCGLRGFRQGGSGSAGRLPRLLAPSVLSHLEDLDLSENDLSCWRDGDGNGVADELEALPKLSTLDLSRNPRVTSLSSSFSSSFSSSSSPVSSFAALKDLRLAECGLSSWAELGCVFVVEEGEGRDGEREAKAAAETEVPSFPSLAWLRLSGNPLPVPQPTTGCARADIVARLRDEISSLNGARIGVRERADAKRALEAAAEGTRRRRRRSGATEEAAAAEAAAVAGLSLRGGSLSARSGPAPPMAATGIMAPMAASMLELRIVLSEDDPLLSCSVGAAATAAATAGAPAEEEGAKTTKPKPAKPPVKLPGSTTVTRLRQLVARLTGVPAREQVLRVEMRGGGGGGCAPAAAPAADDGGDSSSPSPSSSFVLLELTPEDESRDLRFLGVTSGSLVRVSRR